MACALNNQSLQHYTLVMGWLMSYFITVGLSKYVSVVCTRIRPSSSAEKLSFTSNPNPGEAVMIQATMLPDQQDCEAVQVMSTTSVDFPPVCPKDASFQTIIIKNFRYMVQNGI